MLNIFWGSNSATTCLIRILSSGLLLSLIFLRRRWVSVVLCERLQSINYPQSIVIVISWDWANQILFASDQAWLPFRFPAGFDLPASHSHIQMLVSFLLLLIVDASTFDGGSSLISLKTWSTCASWAMSAFDNPNSVGKCLTKEGCLMALMPMMPWKGRDLMVQNLSSILR